MSGTMAPGRNPEEPAAQPRGFATGFPAPE